MTMEEEKVMSVFVTAFKLLDYGGLQHSNPKAATKIPTAMRRQIYQQLQKQAAITNHL